MNQCDDIAQKVVIVDDPISSLDINRINETACCLKDLSDKCKQLIVLTHDIMFVKNLHDEFRDDLLELRFQDSCMGKLDVDKLTYDDYYKNYFILDDFLIKNKGEEINVIRSIRPLLEGRLRIQFPKEFPLNEWLGDYIEKIRVAGEDSPLCKIKGRLPEIEHINDYSRKYHHAGNSISDSIPINRTELRNYVERTLKLCS